MQEFLWEHKYRPTKIVDCVLPTSIKTTLTAFLEQGNLPNFIFHGPSGMGKTTAAMALCDEINASYLIIRGSIEGRSIDVLRTEVMAFASTVSLMGGRKYVIFDEADYMNSQSVQPALRNFMDEYSHNCGFIFTCNFPARLIDPVRSRCTEVAFKIPKEERPVLAGEFMERVSSILMKEGVAYHPQVVAAVITKCFPDFRKTLGELQRYAATTNNSIDAGILTSLSGGESIKQLVGYIKGRKFDDMRRWVADNIDEGATVIMKNLYHHILDNNLLKKSSIPTAVITIARYQYQDAFAADPEINLSACLVELMVEAWND